MFKMFRNIGIILLLISSFIYTERITNVVKEYDQIMIKIKNNKSLFEVKPKEAFINKNTFVPGTNGRKVDIDKTYTKMREYGKYNEELIIYKKITPKHKLENNKNKFIIKGIKDNKVAIIINQNNIDNILNYNEKINVFITNYGYKKNKDKIKKLVDKGYIFLSNNNKYLKKIIGQKNGYCLSENYDDEILKKCEQNNDFTIVPNIIINNNSLIKIEKEIDSGSIIYVKSNNYDNIIKYIKNKGFEIVSIEELLNEDLLK